MVAVEKGSSAAENKFSPAITFEALMTSMCRTCPLQDLLHAQGRSRAQVKISLYESALEKPKDFTLTRKDITKPYLESYVAQPKIGYIGIHHLSPALMVRLQTRSTGSTSRARTASSWI